MKFSLCALKSQLPPKLYTLMFTWPVLGINLMTFVAQDLVPEQVDSRNTVFLS